jgi:hypothetical protein
MAFLAVQITWQAGYLLAAPSAPQAEHIFDMTVSSEDFQLMIFPDVPNHSFAAC